MARYCGDADSGPILEAAAHWRRVALGADGSVFSDKPLWQVQHLESLQVHFVESPDASERSFFEKLQDQLQAAPAEAKQLAAEMLWLMFLCPSNISAGKKRESIELVWSWSGERLPANSWLVDPVLAGVGSAGTSYGVYRWRELAFFIKFMQLMKAMPVAERHALLQEPWSFARWVDDIPESKHRQLRHMLLFLLFPDTFERIFSGGDRRLIVQNFTGMSRPKVRQLSALEMDQELARLRAAEQERKPNEKLDFYLSPLREQWQSEEFDLKTASIEREHVLAALTAIDTQGIPAGAESTLYDLIEGTKRYPPKLVLSLASEQAGGEPLDRSVFSGGVGSPAFTLLRSLGFHIERKDLIVELMKSFLAQADEGTQLAVKGYPDAYRGLKLRVSFGKGTHAKVPWVAFLGAGQESQNGSYPVFLYYKAAGVLILARGISDTATPKLMWPYVMGAQTIDQYFNALHGKDAERYGNSFVFKAYRMTGGTDLSSVTRDVDELLAEYITLLDSTPADAPVTPPSPPVHEGLGPLIASEADPSKAYTVKEAAEELFIEQASFEQIKSVWKKKKNLIVQGPPGVGKTFFYRQLAYALMGSKDPDRLTTVQFHPSYAYEDFVQGYRPSSNGFVLRDGVFFRACLRAQRDMGRRHVFVIDEVNRGNLAKIFGELLMLLEADKRGEEWAVPLAYSDESAKKFFIPKNLYVLGLMNTADRSLAVVDYALRRRFAFVDLEPAYKSPKFKEFLQEKGVSDALRTKIISQMIKLNERIATDTANLGPGFCIGHSYFSSPPEDVAEHDDWFQRVVDTEIAPLLREYFFDNPSQADDLVKLLK